MKMVLLKFELFTDEQLLSVFQKIKAGKYIPPTEEMTHVQLICYIEYCNRHYNSHGELKSKNLIVELCKRYIKLRDAISNFDNAIELFQNSVDLR